MITLNAKKREKVKRDGVSIPAVVYGPKIETSLLVAKKEDKLKK
ncbi:MAG: hypothetical protein PHH50_00910 [Candidatus Pacebacteria bacterium]|nr:hypothetical protein [Candidatus Paceibacterota bacterium]